MSSTRRASRPAAFQSECDFADGIRPPNHTHPSDGEIQRFAADARHGVVTLAELEALGLGPRGARHRAASGRLHRVHRGVYATRPLDETGRWMAAVLACGDGAVLSHRSAAALWGVGPDRRPIDVAVTGGQPCSTERLTVHRLTLERDDIALRDGIPCTALARTLVDLAAVVDRHALERALDRAEELRIFDLASLRAQIRRMSGQRGTGALAAALAAYDPDLTRSAAERRLLALVRRGRLPQPEVNAWLALPDGSGYRPDLLWRAERLIVEVDGRSHHARRRAFEHDRQRDRRLALLGFETRRYAAREVADDGPAVLGELRAFLAR
jgi:very-short-patch-repair endonuclease/predicted transcriptional regulator of viral defense system